MPDVGNSYLNFFALVSYVNGNGSNSTHQRFTVYSNSRMRLLSPSLSRICSKSAYFPNYPRTSQVERQIFRDRAISDITINEVEIYDGHDVLCFNLVRILAAMKSEPFNIDYYFNCRNLPTSRRLGIIYEHKPDTRNVSCSVTFSRTDVGNGYLNFFALVSYVDGNGSNSPHQFTVYSNTINEVSIPVFVVYGQIVLTVEIFIVHHHWRGKSSKMAAREVKISDNEVCDGHDVLYFIPVRILAAFNSEPFYLYHNINCRNLPTSWRLRIIYELKPDTGEVSCSVTFSRTDNGNGCLHTFVLVSYVDSNGRFIRYPRLVCVGQVLAGGEIQGSVEETRYPGYRSYIFSLGLVLRVSMFVRNCHSGLKSHDSKNSRTDMKEAHHSKM